jgi:hypothetical protein
VATHALPIHFWHPQVLLVIERYLGGRLGGALDDRAHPRCICVVTRAATCRVWTPAARAVI